MNHLKQVVTLSVVDLKSQKEIERKVIESPQVYQEAQEKIRWLNQGYSVERIIKEGQESDLFVTFYLRVKEILIFPTEYKHGGDKVDPQADLCWPEGVDQADLNRSVKRVIQLTYEDGRSATDPIIQNVVLSRSALVNFASGEVRYLPWKSSTGEMVFPSVKIPVLPGYEADQPEVPALDLLSLKQNVNVVELSIVYKRSQQAIAIQVVDDEQGTVLEEETVDGKTGDAIRYPSQDVITRYVAKGYELVHNDLETPQYIRVDSPRVYQIRFKERVVSFEQSSLFPEVGSPVYPEMEDSVLWPEGSGEESLHKVVKRTIYFLYEDGSYALPLTEQVAHFYRRAQVHLATGTVLYGPWRSELEDFASVEAPKLSGYIAKPRLVPQWHHLSPAQEDRVETIVYTKMIQKLVLNFVDESQSGSILESIQLVGRSGDAIHYRPDPKIAELLKAGYELISSDFPEQGVFGSTYGEVVSYQIRLRQRQVLVEAEAPKVAGQPVDEQALQGPYWPKGVEAQDLVRKVGRTIHFCKEDGSEAFAPSVHQLTFKRDARVNLVTGEVTYLEWNQASQVFPEVRIPSMEQYEADRQIIPEMMVTPEAAYQELTVYYRKVEDPKYLRVYEGQTDYVLKEKQTYSQEIGLITKEFDHLLEPLFESGYALYNPNKKIAYPFEEKDSEIFLRVVPVVVSLTVKEPHEAFSPMVDYPRLVWPSGLEKSDLSKTLKRTIRYCYNGASETFQEDYQEFELTREATVTLSTGEVRYSSWKTGASGFPSIHPPKVEGYQAEVEVVASRPLKAIQSDEVVTVYYWPLAGVIHIEYRDGSKPIKNDVLVGGIGERVTYQLLSFPGYELAETDCPQTIVFSEEEQSFTVQLQAKRKMVDYQHPLRARSFVQQDGYLLTVPAGLEVENLTYVNQRVIQFLSDTGESLLDEVVQESRVSRLAEWNLATAKVTYGEWLVDSAFSEVSLPEIEGYETSEGPITELTVQATGVTQVIRKQITYHKRPYRFYIRVFEEGAKAALEELVLTVRPGETPLYSLDQLVEAYDHLGYQLLETKVVGEEEFDRHVDLILSARRLSIDSDLVRSDYKGLDEELVTLLRQLPPLYLHQLERGIKRTIRYLSVDRKELVPELVSQVFFEREADMNLVTGEVTFGEWMSSYPTFDATVSPLIPGYQTDKEFMGSIEVTSPEASDIFEEVIYTPTDASIVVDSQEAAPVYQAPALSVVAKKEVVEEEKGEPAAAMVENSFKGSKPAEASGFWSKFKKRFFSK